MRDVVDLAIPGGLVWVAALLLFRPGVLPDSALPVLRVFPAAVFVIGILLGWYFNRTRVVFAVLILALAEQAVRQFGPAIEATAGTNRIVLNAVALLLPLNLVGFSLIRERGLFTPLGVMRLALILLQVPLVAFVCRPSQRELAGLLENRWLELGVAAWTSLPQPSLVAFGAGFALLVVRFILKRGAIERGFVWALVASFTALQVSRLGWDTAAFLATAGLVFAISVIEMSYWIAYHDELTGLLGRRAGEPVRRGDGGHRSFQAIQRPIRARSG
jgi:hypothetical protein